MFLLWDSNLYDTSNYYNEDLLWGLFIRLFAIPSPKCLCFRCDNWTRTSDLCRKDAWRLSCSFYQLNYITQTTPTILRVGYKYILTLTLYTAESQAQSHFPYCYIYTSQIFNIPRNRESIINVFQHF